MGRRGMHFLDERGVFFGMMEVYVCRRVRSRECMCFSVCVVSVFIVQCLSFMTALGSLSIILFS